MKKPKTQNSYPKTLVWFLTMIIIATPVLADCTGENDAIYGFTFDDSDVFTTDVTGNNHNLTNQGSINRTGIINEGRYLVTNDYLQIGTPEYIVTYTNFSVIAWFNATSGGASGAIITESTDNTNNDWWTIIVEDDGGGGDVKVYPVAGGVGLDTLDGGADVRDGTWHHLVVTRAGDLFKIFINGELDVSGNIADFSTIAVNTADIGIIDRTADYLPWNGGLDEVYVYNRTITGAEINNSFNSGNGCQPYKVGVIPQIDLLFTNETTTTYKTLFDEGEEILGFINWTLDNGTIIDNTTGTCNMTFVAGVLEDRSNNTNFTICNTGCGFDTFTEQFSFHSANLTDPVIEDTVRFDACHITSPVRDISVSVQCGLITNNFVVDKSEFPLCSTGTGSIIVNFTDCINSLAVNASVGNGALNIGQGHNIVNFEVDREYVAHLNTGADIIYNTTLKMFQTAHTHEYYKQGSKEIFANCTNTNINFSVNASENITIVNIPPQIFIEQVTTLLGTTALFDGVEIEFANGTWAWFIAVVDNDIDLINYSWYNSSGTLLFSQTENGTPETINTSSTIFADFGGNPFNLTVFANDTFGNTTILSLIFNVTDTLNPSCDFASRYFVELGNFTFNVICADENFFSLNVTCPANNVSFNVTGLNVPEYVFNQTFFLNVTDTCSFRYCDGHTTASLIDVWFDSLNDEKYELFRNFQKVSELWVEDGEVEFVQLHDRLKFNIRFYDTKKAYQTVYYNVSPQSTHLFSTKYLGWVADPVSETWFDLNNIVDAPVITINKGGGLWEFRIYTVEKEVEFQSIGELNCVSGSFAVVAAFEYTLEPGVCPTTVAGVLTMWMVLGLALFLMTVGWVWKIREPGFFGSLLLITFSWTVVACHLFAGYVCAGIGLYFLFWFILKK